MKKFVDRYNSIYHHSISKKPIDVDYSAYTENVETNFRAPKFKFIDRVRITKYKNIFSKGCTQNWSREIIVIDSVLKTIPWTYKIEQLKGKKIMASFYEKKLLLLSIS